MSRTSRPSSPVSRTPVKGANKTSKIDTKIKRMEHKVEAIDEKIERKISPPKPQTVEEELMNRPSQVSPRRIAQIRSRSTERTDSKDVEDVQPSRPLIRRRSQERMEDVQPSPPLIRRRSQERVEDVEPRRPLIRRRSQERMEDVEPSRPLIRRRSQERMEDTPVSRPLMRRQVEDVRPARPFVLRESQEGVEDAQEAVEKSRPLRPLIRRGSPPVAGDAQPDIKQPRIRRVTDDRESVINQTRKFEENNMRVRASALNGYDPVITAIQDFINTGDDTELIRISQQDPNLTDNGDGTYSYLIRPKNM